MTNLIKNYRDDDRVTDYNFILSEIDAEFLRENEIKQTVEQFKQNVRCCNKYFVVETGNSTKGMQHTRVYDIRDFQNGEDYTKFHRIKIRIEEKTEILQKFVNFLNFCEKSNFLKILQISNDYPNNNSVFARKYLTIDFIDADEIESQIANKDKQIEKIRSFNIALYASLSQLLEKQYSDDVPTIIDQLTAQNNSYTTDLYKCNLYCEKLVHENQRLTELYDELNAKYCAEKDKNMILQEQLKGNAENEEM